MQKLPGCKTVFLGLIVTNLSPLLKQEKLNTLAANSGLIDSCLKEKVAQTLQDYYKTHVLGLHSKTIQWPTTASFPALSVMLWGI